MAAAHEQRLTVYRPVLWRFIKRHSIDGYGDDIYGRFFWTESFQELYVLRIDPRGLGLQWPRRGTTPTVCFPYDGPRGDGASCMINIERLAPNRAYFNLELEALEGDEKRITEIKFDGNRLRCYGGWAVEDSATVAPTVRARTWLKLDAVLEDGPPPRLLLRVDGQLLYAMPLATRVRLRGVVLKGWANRSGRTNYARLAITDSVACAAARLVSLWLLRRANSDVALVVLAFALPAPLLDMLRANSTALRGKRQWSYLGDYTRDRGGPLPTVDTQGGLIWPRIVILPPPPRLHDDGFLAPHPARNARARRRVWRPCPPPGKRRRRLNAPYAGSPSPLQRLVVCLQEASAPAAPLPFIAPIPRQPTIWIIRGHGGYVHHDPRASPRCNGLTRHRSTGA